MKFADKETSEELHNLIKETGVKVPESEFHLVNSRIRNLNYFQNECTGDIIIPAYSFDEIWSMLPCLIGIEGIGGFDLHICKTNLYTFCSYYDFIRQLDIFDHRKQYKNNNPTQAASELLIWVIKSHRGAFIKHTGKLGL